MSWLINYLVYPVGACILCVAGTFCLATGLYTAAEWLEDHIRTSHKLILRGTLACAGLQALWLLLDPQLRWPNLIGLASHANSWYMLTHHYPHHMAMDQPPTWAAMALLVAHQTAWIYNWAHHYGDVWHIAAVLATVVWPIPTMLTLSAAGESDLPTTNTHARAGNGAPDSPAIGGRPGSPFLDAARRQVARTLQQRHHHHLGGGGSAGGAVDDPLLPCSRDTGRESDQAAGAGLLKRLHKRSGSNGWDYSGGSSGGSGSFSSGGWAGLAEQLQQQVAAKRHHSRVVQALDGLFTVMGQHGLLPATTQGGGPVSMGISRQQQAV